MFTLDIRGHDLPPRREFGVADCSQGEDAVLEQDGRRRPTNGGLFVACDRVSKESREVTAPGICRECAISLRELLAPGYFPTTFLRSATARWPHFHKSSVSAKRSSRPASHDVPGEVQQQLARLELGHKVRPGQSVAITAGSRGIANHRGDYPGDCRTPQAAWAPSRSSCRRWAATAAARPKDSGSCSSPTASPRSPSAARSARAWKRSSWAGAAEGFPIHFDRLAFEADHVAGLQPRQAAHRLLPARSRAA